MRLRPIVVDPAVRAAGLDGLTPYSLRRTAASLAITSGADAKVVQQMLGHASITMTPKWPVGSTRCGYRAVDLEVQLRPSTNAELIIFSS